MQRLASKFLQLVPWSVRRWLGSIPIIGQLQRLLVSRMFGDSEFVYTVDAGPAKGITFLVRLPEDKGIWTGTYELNFTRLLASAIKPHAVAYDIGGWHGFFAGVMTAQGAREVHVFEPLPENAERIRRLIELNPLRTIFLHSAAAGARDSEMDLLVMPQTSMSKLEASPFQDAGSLQSRVRVRVRSIDSMIANDGILPPDVIKIDVEGAELLVLTGAVQTLRTYHPEIFAEIHSPDLLKACSNLLASEGYIVESIDLGAAASQERGICQIWAHFNS